MKKPVVVPVTQFLLVFLLAYTGVSKWLGYEKFKGVLSQSPWINTWAPAIAFLLPVIELVIAVLLVIPATAYLGLLASLAILFVFTCYLILMILFAPHMPCACGGVIESLGWRSHILFNLFFLGMSFAAVYYYDHHKGVSQKPAKE